MLNLRKRMLAILLAAAMLLTALPLSAFAATVEALPDPESATEEELIKHRSELLEVADEAGFATEYELFFAVLEDLDERGEFWEYNNFALYCRSMSDELLLELLGYLRKYVKAGAVAGYSAVSATEEFFDEQAYNIYYTFLAREEFLGLIRAEDLKQFENTPMFTKNLPAYYYYPTEADLPNELELTVELSPAVMAAIDGVGAHWIASTGGHYSQNLLEDNMDVDMEFVGNRATLRLSADDILKFACDVQTNHYSSTGGFWVRYYAGGYLSDPCYIAIGTNAFFEGSPGYGSREQGSFILDFNTDRLSADTQVIYEWDLSAAVPEWVLQGNFDDSMWDGPFTTTEPVLTVEDITRLLVRLHILPYVNMVGSTNRAGLLLLERISPVIALLPALSYGLGYTQGVRMRTRVHTDIAAGKRKRAQKERRQRQARVKAAKGPEQLN